MKVPSIGWYEIKKTKNNDKVFTEKFIEKNNKFYFIHSFYATGVSKKKYLRFIKNYIGYKKNKKNSSIVLERYLNKIISKY